MNTQKIANILTTIANNILDLRDALIPPTLGMNMAGVVDYSSEIVFNNLFLQSRQWTSQGPGLDYDKGPKLELDTTGYPTKLAGDGFFAESMMLVDINGHVPKGPYILTFDGTGVIRFNGMATGTYSTSGSMVPINPNGAPFLALQIIHTDPNNPIKNIKFGTMTALMFQDGLINRYKDKYKVVRLMDWMNINDENNPQINWVDRAKLTDRSYALGKGVPVEVACFFANAINADPWFCIPHLATDDYVRFLAATIYDNIGPDKTIYLEYTNEAWNNIMPQAKWCQDQGVINKLATDNYEAQIRFYAQRTQQVHKIFQANYKGKVVRIISAYHKDIRTGIWALDQIKNDCDALAIAPYWGHGDQLGDIENSSLDNLLDRASALIDTNKAFTTNYAALAHNNNIKLFAYEGGQHMAKPDASNIVIDKLCQANRHPRLKDLYIKDLKNWKDVGGDLFMIFSSMGIYGRSGSWGVLEYMDQDTSPKLEGIKEYIG